MYVKGQRPLVCKKVQGTPHTIFLTAVIGVPWVARLIFQDLQDERRNLLDEGDGGEVNWIVAFVLCDPSSSHAAASAGTFRAEYFLGIRRHIHETGVGAEL